MAKIGVFTPDNTATQGGLDRFIAPPAADFSGLPTAIENPNEAGSRPVDCEGADKDEAVCQIAKAESELEHRPAEKS